MTIEDIKLEDSERTRTEVITRVMGYLRPVECFNRGKKEEFYERKCFTEEKAVQRMNEDVEVLLAAE